MLYRNIADTIKHGYVPQETRLSIDKIYADPTIAAEKKAKMAFDAVIDERLKLVDPKLQPELRKLLNERVNIQYTESGDINGYFHGSNSGKLDKDTIEMSMPNSMRESVLQYVALTHEYEHAISVAIERGGVEQKINPITIPKEIFKALWHGQGRIFENEAGSMMAEYEYLSTIPANVRAEIAKSIEADPTVPKNTKNLTLRWLKSDATTPQEHLKNERNLGRYSMENAKELNNQQIKGFSMMAGIFTVPTASLGMASYMHYHCKTVRENVQQAKPVGPLEKDFCAGYP
jgi:hypothetical protein